MTRKHHPITSELLLQLLIIRLLLILILALISPTALSAAWPSLPMVYRAAPGPPVRLEMTAAKEAPFVAQITSAPR